MRIFLLVRILKVSISFKSSGTKFFFLRSPKKPTKIDVQTAKSSGSSILTKVYIFLRCSIVIGNACRGALANLLLRDWSVSLRRKDSLSKGRSRILWRNPTEPMTFLMWSYPHVTAMISANRIKLSVEAGRIQRPKKMVKKSHCLMWLKMLREEFLAW